MSCPACHNKAGLGTGRGHCSPYLHHKRGSVLVENFSSELEISKADAVMSMVEMDLTWPGWQAESLPTISDLRVLPFFALVFAAVRFFLEKLIFEKLGQRFITGYTVSLKTSSDEVEVNRKKLVKFTESSWKCVYFFTAEILALVVTYNEPWFTETKYFWTGPGNQQWPDQLIKLKLKFLYGFAGGFYLYSIFALIFWETRRSDFGVSMSHHVASLTLIVVSYLANLARIGSVVLAVHDASDVFLEIGKLTKYSGLVVVPSISFILFAISWVILRLIIFPFVLIRSASFESPQYFGTLLVGGTTYYYVFNTLLITLQVMHIYWWVLIWRMLMEQIQDRGKVSDDVRSDSDSDSEPILDPTKDSDWESDSDDEVKGKRD